MKGPETQGLSLDVFESLRQDRLSGEALRDASGERTLMVAYEGHARHFDTVVSHVGKSISGASVVTLSATDPESKQSFELTLKTRDGMIPARRLKYTALRKFGGLPIAAYLQKTPDEMANLTTEDAARFHEAWEAHEARKKTPSQTRFYSGLAHIGGMAVPPMHIGRSGPRKKYTPAVGMLGGVPLLTIARLFAPTRRG